MIGIRKKFVHSTDYNGMQFLRSTRPQCHDMRKGQEACSGKRKELGWNYQLWLDLDSDWRMVAWLISEWLRSWSNASYCTRELTLNKFLVLDSILFCWVFHSILRTHFYGHLLGPLPVLLNVDERLRYLIKQNTLRCSNFAGMHCEWRHKWYLQQHSHGADKISLQRPFSFYVFNVFE